LVLESVVDAVGWSDDGVLLVTGDRYSAHLVCYFMRLQAVQ